MIGIFGASGFIGRNLIDLLVADGVAFQAFARRPVPGVEDQTVIIDFDRAETYVHHLNRLTSVVLLASASVPSTFANDIGSEVKQNVLPYSRFLTLSQHFSIQHLVYLSSGGAVYGVPQADLVSESHPTNPISPYGCGKLMIEEMIRTVSRTASWTYTVFRPSNPIGRYQSPDKGQGLVAHVLDASVTGRAVEIWGDGSSLRDYVDVRDVCRAIAIALTHSRAKNEVFNVGMGRAYSVNDILNICANVTGINVERRYTAEKEYLVRDVVIDVAKANRFLGWTATYDISSAIKSQFLGITYS
jgi:UDP-glucose 4-epimerase